MIKYDFIIGYEHKNREIESVCLLKCELEKRGYKVMVYCIYDIGVREYTHKFSTEVLVLPYCYDNQSLLGCFYGVIKFKKIINMQWEQAIYRQQEENKHSFKNPSGLCKKAVHLSWGQANVDRLIKVANISPQNVKLVGNITLDFLKTPLSSYYLSRKEICNMYDIPEDKKVCLFIASFKSATLGEEEIDELCRIYGEWRREHHDIARKTMHTVLYWLEEALKNNPDTYFIYRPHPGEDISLVTEIAQSNDRFLVIGDLSVKQWILMADKIYTWMSTSIVEIFFANKKCEILYPYELDKLANAKIFENARTINNMQEFLETIKGEAKTFPISENDINEYYLIDEKMSYLKIVEVFQEVYKNKCYNIEKNDWKLFYNEVYRKKSVLKQITSYLWQVSAVYMLFWKVSKCFPHSKYVNRKYEEKRYYERLLSIENVSQNEISKICENIRKYI